MSAPKVKIAKDWWSIDAKERPAATRMISLFEQAKVTSVQDLPQFLNAREAAPYLKVHPKTAADLMKSQIVRSTRIRGRRYTTPEWIADYFRTQVAVNGQG